VPHHNLVTGTSQHTVNANELCTKALTRSRWSEYYHMWGRPQGSRVYW